LYCKAAATAVTALILLDRDGVINEDSPDYIKSVEEFVPLPGALEAMARLHHAGFKLGICTNQSAVGRGLISDDGVREIHQRIHVELQRLGGALAGIAYCPHLPTDDCDCRKPKPGMLLSLMGSLDATAAQTTFVGDSMRDLEAAAAAGCRGVLVRTGNGAAVESAARAAGFGEIHDDLNAFAAAEIRRQGGASQQQ
jgi:D-glycero-D-manno-heptose 1,7-bisphosphate phosphatase